MGIDKFHTWLKNTYYVAIVNEERKYDHIYLDLNFLLHRLVSYVSSEEELLNKVIFTINSFVVSHPPKKTLNLVADGSASYAKVLLQKKRRLQTAQSILEHNGDINDLNPLHLTSGTKFMNKFNERIIKYISDNEDKFSNIKVNLNLSDQPDESEFKICRMMKNNCKKTTLDTHLIFSNDADTILIAMGMTDIFGIYVMVQMMGNDSYIISIDELINEFMKMYGYKLQKRSDFVFISLLNGNDYFPKLKYANFNNLWEAYKSSILPTESIVNFDNSINIKNMIKFLYVFMSNLTKKKRLVSLQDTCDPNIETYLIGIQWCISLYFSGDPTYDYIYNGDSIHPMCLILHINNMKKIIVPELETPKISSDIYPVIVLPYCAKDLIPKKFYNLIETKLQFMYEEEFCQKCNAYRENKETSLVKCIDHKKTHDINNPQKYIRKIIKIIKE